MKNQIDYIIEYNVRESTWVNLMTLDSLKSAREQLKLFRKSYHKTTKFRICRFTARWTKQIIKG